MCIAKISQQAEVKVIVPISQESNLQRLDQIFDGLVVAEHCRNDHQRARFWRNAQRVIHSR